jgi:hypothetical protein
MSGKLHCSTDEYNYVSSFDYYKDIEKHPVNAKDSKTLNKTKMPERDVVPCSILFAKCMQQGSTFENPLQVFFDQGSDKTFIHHAQCLPPGVKPSVTIKKIGKTISGQVISTRQVTLQDIVMSKFSKHHVLDEQPCQIFDAKRLAL